MLSWALTEEQDAGEGRAPAYGAEGQAQEPSGVLSREGIRWPLPEGPGLLTVN